MFIKIKALQQNQLLRLLFLCLSFSVSGSIAARAQSVSFSTTPLVWGSVAVGQTSGAKVVTITNNQTAALTFSSIGLPSGSDFLESATTCPIGSTSLAAGASCTVSLQFRPLASGTRTGSLTLTDDAASGATQTLPLSGTGIVGATLFSPTTLSFTSAPGVASAAQTVTLTNELTTALSITSIKASGQFAQTNTCGSSLAAQASCSIAVTYTPTTSAASSSTLTVAYTGASSGSAQAYLSGTPQVNSVTLSPASHDFGSVTQGAAGSSSTFTLTNSYTEALTISSIATGLADYTSSSTCPVAPATLASGGTCDITVTFTPATTGTRSDTLTVSHNAPGSQTTAALTGTGVAASAAATAAISFSPSTLSWGNVAVGQTSGAKVLTVTNGSTSAVTFNSLVVGSDFTQSATTCPVSPSTLAAGASCTVSVTFQPLATGARSNAVTFTDNAAGSPQTVSLTGTGTTGPVLFSPTSLSFPSTTSGTTSAKQTSTVTNTQSTALAITGITVAAQFTQTNNCPASLPANGSCTVTVAFAPTSTGSKTGYVNVKYAAGTTSLYTSGTAPGATTPTGTVSVSPKSYSFATSAGNMDQAIGTTSSPVPVTLTNSQNTALSISSIVLAAPFAQTNNCGSSVAAGGSCTIYVTYSPSVTGFSSTTLSIADSAANSPQSVAISGNAVAPVSLVPVTGGLGFYSQIVQTPSSSQSVTLTNNLASTLTISAINSTADYPYTSSCVGANGSGTLASRASCTINVSFDPQATGSRPATMTIAESASTTPISIPLTGSGIAGDDGPSITVAPNTPCVAPSASVQLSVFTSDLSSSAVKWYVNGVLNGNSSIGTITTGGLYTAPAATGTRTITATSQSSTSVSGSQTLTITSAPLFEIYPYTSSLPAKGTQVFQAQKCTTPDTNPVSFTVNGVAGGNAAVGTITADGVYTAPATPGKYTVKVTDSTVGKTTGAVVTVFPAVTVDFGSRTSTTYPVPADLIGYGRAESIQSTSDRQLLSEGGQTTARLYAQIPQVYATTTPDWTKVDPYIASAQAAGQKVMLQVSLSPTWLQPTTGTCKGNSAAAPTSASQWAALAQAYVAHMDASFPGVVTDYEIWNEPNASGMCSSNNLNNYMALYAAAAPLMKQQASNDGTTIRVGGPVLSGYSPSWVTTLLTTASTAPYVDFISYHNYLFGGDALQVDWDQYNGNTSLYQATTDPSNGAQAIYNRFYTLVAAGKQPLGAKTPIYVTEFNTNFAFAKDCCRNDATYAPVWNALYVTSLLNNTYAAGVPVPAKLMYFAGSAYPYFCLIGTIDDNMDCGYSRGSDPSPYPQYYAFQLLSSPNYLGLAAGGYLAPTVTPPTGGGGIAVAAFYTPSQNSIMITNPSGNALTNVPLTLANTGLTSPSATLYQIVDGASITSSSLSLTASGSGYSAVIPSIPAYSVMGISLKGR